MLQLAPKSEYADVMERALFNTVIGSMAQDGRHFFYVNPLEVWPAACRHNPGKAHVKPVRPGWFACACCPPNVARLLSSLGEYVYTMNDDTLYAHLYIGGEAEVRFGDVPVKVMQNSALPWDGDVTLTLQPEQAVEWTVALRIPDWSRGKAGLRVNGQEMNVEDITQDGYACVKRVWAPGDTVELAFSMEIHQVRANPNIRGMPARPRFSAGRSYTAWKASIMECLYPRYRSRAIRSFVHDLIRIFGGAVVIEGAGWLEESDDWGDEQLYRSSPKRCFPHH